MARPVLWRRMALAVLPCRWPVAAALLTISPPRQAQAQSSPELAGTLARQVAAEGSLVWTSHRLSWKNFHGRPRLGTSTAAQTSSGVTYIVECHGERFRFAALATFSPSESWVRPDVPAHRTASPRTLKHEQTHFDITEILARRLRRAFSSARGICPRHPKNARKLFDRLSRESQSLQERYDKETAHGTALDAQARWSRTVAASLDSLGQFRQE